MATKTIVIEDPKDYQVGDHFEGTVRDGETVISVSGPIRESSISYRLFVASYTPYADSKRWDTVRVTREVEIPSKYLDFEVGALVEHRDTGSRYIRTGDGWIGIESGFYFTVQETDASIQWRTGYEKYYTLLYGPEPKGRPE